MTIEERIEELISSANNLATEVWIEEKITDLLNQVAKEQREICAEYFPPIKGYSDVYDDIKNAPSPLD